MNNLPKEYVGVDVSLESLDVSVYPKNNHFKVQNNENGIKTLIKKISYFNVERVACESTGGYEKTLLKLLRKANYHVELLDPRLVKYFILSKNVKAKTDKIDSYMIALYTANNEPRYKKPILSEKHEELRELTNRRYTAVKMVAEEKKRLLQSNLIKVKDFITKNIEFLNLQIEEIDKEVKTLIDNDEQWKNKFKIFLSIPGIGKVTSAILISDMPELGTIENKQAASLLGVAPHTKQSGNYQGLSMISGGRFRVRQIAYMAALSASHGKGKLTDYYKKLKAKDKKAKVCLVALMNKMISVANALLRKNEIWNPTF